MTAPSGSRDRSAKHDSRERIDDEHRRLRQLLADTDAAAGTTAMVPLLEKLQSLLEEHFEHEEAEGGMPGMVSERAPQLMHQLDDLMHEHAEFMSDVTSLIERARRKDDPRAVHSAFKHLAARLHDHESRETDLIMDAFESDLGGGD